MGRQGNGLTAIIEVVYNVEEPGLILHLTEQVYQRFAKIAQRQEMAIEDVIEDALALEEFIADARQEGWRLFVVRRGRFSEVLETS